jgi:hypothetical protein
MDALWKSMMDNGGHSVFAGISKFFDNEEKPAYTPGSSLSAVKSAAASLNMAHMSVTAGSVTVTGLGAGSAPGAASIPGLPDHPHTPTPGSQAGYVDPWMAAFKLRDQAKAASAQGGAMLDFFKARAPAGLDAPDLNAVFAGRVKEAVSAAEAATGTQAQFTSFARSRAQQAILYDKYLSGQGRLAAPPGSSLHEGGGAVDLQAGPSLDWLHAHADQYGLEFLKGKAGAMDPGHMQIAGGWTGL